MLRHAFFDTFVVEQSAQLRIVQAECPHVAKGLLDYGQLGVAANDGLIVAVAVADSQRLAPAVACKPARASKLKEPTS